MKKAIRITLRSISLLILDFCFLNVSLLLAYLLRFDFNFTSIPEQFVNKIVFLLAISTILKIVLFSLFKLYNSLWKYAGALELVLIVTASFVANMILFMYILISLNAPRSIFLITFLLDIFLIGGSRFAYRIYRRLVKGELIGKKGNKRILIVGAGDAGAIIVKELKMHPELKSNPIAIVDDDSKKVYKKLNGVPVMGTTKNIQEVVARKNIDEIIIAIPSAGNKEINDIYKECAKTQCKVKILPSYTQLINESIMIQKIRDVSIDDLLGRDTIKLHNLEAANYIKDKTVLVTGGGGSIGSELCRQIASFKPKLLIILDNYENNAYEIQNELLHMHPKLPLMTIIANVRDRHRLDSVFKKYKPNIVFHAAAHKHVPLMEDNPSEAVKNNILGTYNVAECAAKFRAERFVLISTDKAVNPTNIMGATKRFAEMILQAFDKHHETEFVAVRFGNVLGSNGSVIPIFKKQIEQGGPVTVTHPDINRFFMTIPEAVQLVLSAGAMAQGGEIFVLDMGKPVKIVDLAKNLIRLSGFEPDVDIMIEYTGLRPGEKLYEELLMTEEGLRETSNEKIFVAQPLFSDLSMIRNEIKVLEDILRNDEVVVKEYLKKLVPTYKNIQQEEIG